MTRPSEDHPEPPTPQGKPATPDSRPPLPQRQRQAHLAPQLTEEISPPERTTVRPADLARDTMAAFQRGTRRARGED